MGKDEMPRCEQRREVQVSIRIESLVSCVSAQTLTEFAPFQASKWGYPKNGWEVLGYCRIPCYCTCSASKLITYNIYQSAVYVVMFLVPWFWWSDYFFLQTCVKWCSQSERDAIFDNLQPHLLSLSRKKYAVFLVKKLIELGKRCLTLYEDWILCGYVKMLHDGLM